MECEICGAWTLNLSNNICQICFWEQDIVDESGWSAPNHCSIQEYKGWWAFVSGFRTDERDEMIIFHPAPGNDDGSCWVRRMQRHFLAAYKKDEENRRLAYESICEYTRDMPDVIMFQMFPSGARPYNLLQALRESTAKLYSFQAKIEEWRKEL